MSGCSGIWGLLHNNNAMLEWYRANILHQPPCEMNSVDPVCCPHAVPPLSSFVMFYLLPAICWEITHQYTQQAGQFARLKGVLGNIWPYRSSLTLEAAWSSSAVIQKGLSVIGFCRSLPRTGSQLLELTAANNISVHTYITCIGGVIKISILHIGFISII